MRFAFYKELLAQRALAEKILKLYYRNLFHCDLDFRLRAISFVENRSTLHREFRRREVILFRLTPELSNEQYHIFYDTALGKLNTILKMIDPNNFKPSTRLTIKLCPPIL